LNGCHRLEQIKNGDNMQSKLKIKNRLSNAHFHLRFPKTVERFRIKDLLRESKMGNKFMMICIRKLYCLQENQNRIKLQKKLNMKNIKINVLSVQTVKEIK
jgi:hypothetical protein